MNNMQLRVKELQVGVSKLSAHLEELAGSREFDLEIQSRITRLRGKIEAISAELNQLTGPPLLVYPDLISAGSCILNLFMDMRDGDRETGVKPSYTLQFLCGDVLYRATYITVWGAMKLDKIG